MKYCTRCVMPETKIGIVFDKEGVCQACRYAEKQKEIDWDKRFEELKKLAAKYRRDDGYYDCIIPSSGGKDSHFQAYILKEKLGMNPLLVTVSDPFTKTKAGLHNFQNIGDVFGCDTISLNLSPNLVRRMVRLSTEEFGNPTWVIDRAIFVYPFKVALNMNIPLIVYGENTGCQYGGTDSREMPTTDNILINTVKPIDFDYWQSRGISKKEINALTAPSKEEIKKAKINSIYLGYFIQWDGYRNYQVAKRFGFRDLTHEWKREGYIEDYDQIDSKAYMMNIWFKYPKFGFARATDVACYWIRTGRITREEGIKLVKEHDYKLDQQILQDFLDFTGYTDKEFWNIAEKFYNRDIFEKVNNEWRLKNPIYKR